MTGTRPACHGHGTALVKALNEAITATMNEFGDRHGCGPMHWYLREVNGFDRGDVIGFPGGPNDQDTLPGIRLTESWAQLLGLMERDDEVAGYRAWTGTAGTSRIEIWCREHDQPQTPAAGPVRPAQADPAVESRCPGTGCSDSWGCSDCGAESVGA